MTKIQIDASRRYDVVFDTLLSLSAYLEKILPPKRKAMIVTDDVVCALYLDTVKANLTNAGYDVYSYTIKNGEQSKNLAEFKNILEYATKCKLSRHDFFVALGGGVVGDLTGFVAASYMRGVEFVQIPTTLLSAVDSSVGGKTGVNLESGKNLVGAFWQPSLVLFDKSVLDTLPSEQVKNGLGEIVKYAILEGGEIENILQHGVDKNNVDKLVGLCVASKASIVQQDEKESGLRKVLNLGHTFAHAIEKLSAYTIQHGVAVAKGIAIITQICLKQGFITQECSDKVLALLEKYSFDTCTSYSVKDMIDVIKNDKKATATSVDVVLFNEFGKSFIMPITFEKLEELAS